MSTLQLIKRVTIGGYVKADTVGNGSWEIGRITKFDEKFVWFTSCVDGQEIRIARNEAYKATAEEFNGASKTTEPAAVALTAATEQELDEAFEQEIANAADDLEDPFHNTRSIVPESYRRRYHKTRSAAGTTSLHNGDPVAQMLAGKPLDLCYDILAGYIDDVTLETKIAKWGHLNPGQQRMQIGNAIRAALKKGA